MPPKSSQNPLIFFIDFCIDFFSILWSFFRIFCIHFQWFFGSWSKRLDPLKVSPLSIKSRVQASAGAFKKRAKINRKINRILCDISINFSFILYSFGLHLGFIFGAKFHWKTHSKIHRFLNRFSKHFGSPWTPIWLPKSRQKSIQAALGTQGIPRNLPWSLGTPKGTQNGTNNNPRMPKSSPFGIHLAPIIIPKFDPKSQTCSKSVPNTILSICHIPGPPKIKPKLEKSEKIS